MKKTVFILIVTAVIGFTLVSWNSSKSSNYEETYSIRVVEIGNQIWMLENLNVDRFRNGDRIPQARTREEWERASRNEQPAWCYYDNDPENGGEFGKLYNWYAVNDPRGLAPRGWKIPSNADWRRLSSNLGGDQIAGHQMKSRSGWDENGNGTNTSGFAGVPGGYRYPNGQYSGIGKFAFFWSSTETDTRFASSRFLDYRGRRLRSYDHRKDHALSVRCIKN